MPAAFDHRTIAFVITLALLVVFGGRPAQAQADVRPGLRAGLTSTTYGGNPVDPVTGRLEGYTVGLFTQIDVPGRFGLQPELNYVQKGAEVEGVFEENRTEREGYLEGVLLGRMDLPSWRVMTPNVFAGPSYGTHLEHSKETWYTATDPEFGLVAGMGATVHLDDAEIRALTVDLRYTFALNRHSDADYYTTLPDRSSPSDFCACVPTANSDRHEHRNRGFVFSAGLVF